ncbi:hypothetical protein [Methanobrevibacter sp.]|uniref:hypothetical protein n=1 Tax=Methanobrevibacter sp. TaxID=66852 RepID=UPI00386619D0
MQVLEKWETLPNSAYVNNMFDAEHKIESEKTQFPKDLKKAYELGQRLSGEISKTD